MPKETHPVDEIPSELEPEFEFCRTLFPLTVKRMMALHGWSEQQAVALVRQAFHESVNGGWMYPPLGTYV